MVKTLLLSFLVFLTFNALAISKKRQLQMIESCRIFAEKTAVFAGTQIPTYLAFQLNNGEEVYSNSKSKVGFKDFKISIEGSGEKFWRSKRKLTINSFHNSIHDPYIRIHVQLIERPEIAHTIEIPIHYNGWYRVGLNAPAVTDADDGECGQNGHDGRDEYSHDNGEDGDHGRYGYDGRHGRDGRNAEDVKVYVSLVDFPRDNTQLVKIRSCDANGRCKTRYLSKTGTIKINVIGGHGADGGDGGKGGDGGDGGRGAYESDDEDEGSRKRDGYGGNGGEGGNGGDGGDGGNGGDGGDVSIYFADDAWFFKSQITVNNNGGSGGRGGDGGNAGCGGTYGRGGKGCGNKGNNGRSGRDGESGYTGRAGQVYYYNWNK